MPPPPRQFLPIFRQTNTPPDGMTAEKIMRSLFTAAWTKEGWATGSADGQSLVVEPAEVRQAQDALKKLNYAPGPPTACSDLQRFRPSNCSRKTMA